MQYYDLGEHTRPVTTLAQEAQIWFDRGLNWTYAFNHGAALDCFKRASALDPGCAMSCWGEAYVQGPNYNLPWDRLDDQGRENALAQCYDATQEALRRATSDTGASAKERALIQALTARYPQREPIDDLSPWDRAFADAMREIHAAHPDDLDIRAIFVESLLTLTPWRMWDLTTGEPTQGAATLEAQALLEDAFANQPAALRHPGLLHLYIHLMEMSPWPEKALKAADTLRDLVPDAGHLVHMPTHIDILCGHYQNVVHWNQKAAEADLKYYAAEGAFNIYTGYRQHNYHFVIYGAMFLGQLAPARAALQGLEQTTPEAMLRIPSPPMADFFESYLSFEPHVLVRFGLWEEAIALTPPADPELFCTKAAFVKYARAIAFAATGRITEAEAEEQAFLKACEAVPETRLLHNNRIVDLLEIAKAMVRGEIAYRKQDYAEAFAELRRSVALEDALPYDEPWGWMQPARHALGALLFEQGQTTEAEAVYREDLGLAGDISRASIHPDNVWSLRGLHDCLQARGETVEIVQIRQRLDLALARADNRVAASCFCAQSAMRAAS